MFVIAKTALTTAASLPLTGAPKVSGNWPQIRGGAAIAHLMNGSLDGAIADVVPVLSLPPNMRVGTVTAYTDKLTVVLSVLGIAKPPEFLN